MRPTTQSLIFRILIIFSIFPSTLFANLLSEGETAVAEKNYAKAYRLFSKAAKNGEAGAAYGMGILYSEGWGVKKSDTKAFDWFKVAALQGYPAAQYSIGNAYFKGLGIESNIPEAEMWWDMAAHSGHSQAQFNLGMLLFNSDGPSEAKEQGIAWTRAAALQGVKWADRQLAEIDEPTHYTLITFKPAREPARSEARITTLQANYYTIQLTLTESLKAAIQLIQNNKLEGRALIYRSTQQEKAFGIIYGLYESIDDAQQTITTMKISLKKLNPSIYQIQSIQDTIKAWRIAKFSSPPVTQ